MAIHVIDTIMDPELVEMSLDELELLYKHNNRSISKLQKEIDCCDRQFKLYGPGAELTQQVNIVERSDGSTNLLKINQALQSTFLSLEKRLEETEKLTGMTITRVTESIHFSDDNSSIRKVNLELDILGNRVRLNCDIDTDLTDFQKDTKSGEVSRFTVQFVQSINDAIGESISKFSEEVELHSVLSLIKSYVQSVKERDRIIRELMETYPEHVSHWIQSHNKQGLKVTSGDQRPQFVFEWNIILNDNCQYKEKVNLTVETSREIKRLDTKGILDSASDMFTSMVSIVGVEKALSNFITMILSDGANIVSSHQLQAMQQVDN